MVIHVEKSAPRRCWSRLGSWVLTEAASISTATTVSAGSSPISTVPSNRVNLPRALARPRCFTLKLTLLWLASMDQVPAAGSSTPSTVRTAVAVAVSRIGGSSLFSYTAKDKTAASAVTPRSLPTSRRAVPRAAGGATDVVADDLLERRAPRSRRGPRPLHRVVTPFGPRALRKAPVAASLSRLPRSCCPSVPSHPPGGSSTDHILEFPVPTHERLLRQPPTSGYFGGHLQGAVRAQRLRVHPRPPGPNRWARLATGHRTVPFDERSTVVSTQLQLTRPERGRTESMTGG